MFKDFCYIKAGIMMEEVSYQPATMKTQFSVIFLLVCTAWICRAEKPVADSVDSNPEGQDVTLVEQEQGKEAEVANEVQPVALTTKKPKKPYKRPVGGHKPVHHSISAAMLSDSWPYYPMPYPLPYAPCGYPQAPYYPMPMYTPYMFPPYMFNRKPAKNPVDLDTAESTDSGEEVNAEESVKNADFWNNLATITPTPAPGEPLPSKRFIIRNWLTNKANKKTTTTAATTAAPTMAPMSGM